MTSPLNLQGFYRFCNVLKIDTKEKGLIYLGRELLGTQTYVINQIAEGFERGIHDFTTLKCRQVGISTVSLALDLYWIFKYKAMSGAIITHDEPSRDKFRTTIDMYYDGLPEYAKRVRLANNRNGMLFANKSSLSMRVAGTRATGGGALGRSASFPFLHATEMSSWGDPEGFKSLVASLAETNPLRFYHWESTARGFNHFYDVWEDAKKSISKKCIFVSFWANELYRAPRHSDMWKAYWGHKGRLQPEEKEWVREVKALYDVDIDDTQMAWWRWKVAEQVGDMQTMMQEFPPTENHAFVATGSQFFTAESISNGYKLERTFPRPTHYRVQVGTHFSDTVLLKTPEKLATLRVWEEPKKGAVYVLGADPAYGSSEWADRFCISVFRCYSDKLVQVAEFLDPGMATYSFAWVLAYLAGAFEPCLVNLEINGPGQGVLSELQNMRRTVVVKGMSETNSREARTLTAVTRNISSYLYKRIDNFAGPGAIHTLMGYEMKERMMNTFRDYYERGMIIVKSRNLLDEMKSLERGGRDRSVSASGRSKDDTVVAAGLACLAWNDQRRTTLMMRNDTYERISKEESKGEPQVVDRMVADYLKKIGIKPERMVR